MIKSTAHSHTIFCDGANTAEEMVLAAIDLGFNAFGFSSHSYCDFYTLGISNGNYTDYLDEIARLKEKYKDKIAIYAGLELDSVSEPPLGKFDYILGSVHYVKGLNGEYYSMDSTEEKLKKALYEGFSGDNDALSEAYFNTVDEMLTRLKPDICGHFDLLRCCNGENKVVNTNTSRYKTAALNTLKKHSNSVIFEINTGGVARGKQTRPYPEPWLLNELSKLGGKIMINSDTHAVETINSYYAEAEQLAKNAGFKSVFALAEDGSGIKEFEL